MRGNRRDGLLEVVVLLELRRLFRRGARDFALHLGTAREFRTHETAHVGIVGDALGDDVARELKILVRRRGTVPLERAPFPDCIRERLVALLLRDLRAGAALRLVGLVDVLEARLNKASGNCGAKFVSELALLVDRLEDSLLAGLELGVVFEPVLDLSYRDFVEVSVRFLAVARDKRNRIPFSKKLFDCGDLAGVRPDLRHHAV